MRPGRARGIAAGLVVAGVVVAGVVVAGVVVAGVVVAGVAGLGQDGPAVVVADERGRQVASVPLPPRAGSPSSTSTRSTGPR